MRRNIRDTIATGAPCPIYKVSLISTSNALFYYYLTGTVLFGRSHLVTIHELGRLLDESMTEKERLDLEDAETVCRRFLAWDLNVTDQGINVKTKLAACLGTTVDDDNASA